MPEAPTTYNEGQTATNPKTGERVVFRRGMWIKDATHTPRPQQPRPSAQDQQQLAAASSQAQAERDAVRTYDAALNAVERMGTGPGHARWLDAITADEDGGVLDAVGAIIGAPFRAFYDQETLDARDHLKTISANVALQGSQQMKGASSDKDTALMRMAGVSPYKSEAENRRIIQEARTQSGLAQVRANAKADWITQNGSLSSPSQDGGTFEDMLRRAEETYSIRAPGFGPNGEIIVRAQAGPQPLPDRSRTLPTPPPRRAAAQPVRIDINGNTL